MRNLRDILPRSGRSQKLHCFDRQCRLMVHGPGERYISPTTGKCKPLVVQAVSPSSQNADRREVAVGENVPQMRKLAVWLATNRPLPHPAKTLVWLYKWVLFTVRLLIPFTFTLADPAIHTGIYKPYLSRYHGQLWVARSPREYSLRKDNVEVASIRSVTHLTHPRQLIIYNPATRSWDICDDPNIIKQQRYVAISYRRLDIFPTPMEESARLAAEEEFIRKIEATMMSLNETAYWIDLKLINTEGISREEVNKDMYRMADVYRGAQFTLIMLSPPAGVTEEESWLKYGERLWTFPEVLLSKELRFKFKDDAVTSITLHQLANRAYAEFAEESAIVNAYGLRDPLERLERLSLLKSALWRRTSGALEQHDGFKAERVYALMGFFEHRIYPDFQETELQALARLSMANDNDRIVERMVSLLPAKIADSTGWYAEDDQWGANLWDIEPEIQVVGMTKNDAIVLGGCRAAAIRWKDFPSIAFTTRPSFRRHFTDLASNLSWYILGAGIYVTTRTPVGVVLLVIGLVLVLLAPRMRAYSVSGRIVDAQPWLIGIKGLISAEEADVFLYGGAMGALPRTLYSPSGTPLAKTAKGEFRHGDPTQYDDLKSSDSSEANDLYSLVDTVSATIYYFRASRPPTVCLYTGRDSGLGRFVLCSERCTTNELHKETVIRMPWYISHYMGVCDWVALG